MLFDLKHLHGDRAHVRRTFEPAAFEPPDEDYRVAAPVDLSMEVVKTGADLFRVTGRVTTRLELECGRCLDPFELPVDEAFELRYVPEPAPTATGVEEEREISDDDLTTAFFRENAIDLVELIREQFQLALPMKPLCRDACQGLCASCGANLNRSTCSCQPRWEDPRLAALKGLLDCQKEN